MAIQSQPSRISEPFAGSGTKNTIPATNATPSASQAASWASGFPPECSQPISAGGCPVPRNDVNGVLNQISQDYVFRQDGGIWAWSALADYDTGRFVRGSDNSFYKAAAQNGPGTSAGAKDPTADDGTYWVKMPSMADIAAQNFATQGWVTSQGYATQAWVGNQGYATQAWVNGIVVATVYIDPAGSDSNNGLSASTPVATFAKAVEIASALPSSAGRDMVIQVAAGAYTGDLILSNAQCQLVLQGNVTINGRIGLINSKLLVSGSSYTLTVTASTIYAAVEISQNSYALFECTLSATQNSSGTCLAITVCSGVVFIGNVTVFGNGLGAYALYMEKGSTASFQGSFVIADNSGYANGARIQGCSNASFASGFWIGAGGVSTYTGLAVAECSSCAFYGGTVSLQSGSGAANALNIASGSSVLVESSVNNISFLMYGSGSGSLLVERGSSFVCKTTGFIYFGPDVASCASAICSSTGSSVSFIGSGEVGVQGTYTSIVWCFGDSYVFYDKNKTSSSAPTGKRFNANYCSSIEVDGAGDSHIPGTATGTVYNYSYYG